MQPQDTIPAGLCQCGCGAKTSPSSRFIQGHGSRLRCETVESVLAQVERDDPVGCWTWPGYKCFGYGRVMIHGKNHLLHRFIYESLVGPIPNGLVLDHLCRNRACVNPEHLEVVTSGENQRRGIHTKLRADQIPEIKEMAKTMKYGSIARHFGISPSLVGGIVRGERWKGV